MSFDVCQKCLASFEEDSTQDVEFTVWGKIERRWYLCDNCCDKLVEMVLGYMNEVNTSEGADVGAKPE